MRRSIPLLVLALAAPARAAEGAWRLVPAADDDSRTGLDGEAVPSGAIQAEIFPGALRVFCAAPLAAARTAVSPPERAA